MTPRTRHMMTLQTISRRSGLPREWEVAWRTQSVHCCGQLVVRWDDRHPPVTGWADDVGQPFPMSTHCRQCGTLYTPSYTIELIG